ncbi:hypothetical protein QTO34_009878 [Cnephaeus nilssonii]|uniref:Golgi associated RAB2 interactor protein-like Rab2B-binding domain-containing protein n=1 Tax=Cnephaeus nilssonii TaxID=3371016 RepID=A0AA40HEA4_CNENI|nr:hypothetical protein QTO34_009878 [Eptesicus nilssonii]
MNRLWNMRRVDPRPGPPTWVPILGQLQKTLRQGDYLPLRPLPMFESNFVQVPSSLSQGVGGGGAGPWAGGGAGAAGRSGGWGVGWGCLRGAAGRTGPSRWPRPQVTSRGAPVYVHHRSNHLTMGVAASLPDPVLPDLLLIARPSEGRDCPNLILSRIIPLDLVRLYVHNLSARCLKLRLSTGRYYYLELNAPDREMAFLFDRWVRLISLLQEPPTSGAPRTLSTPLSDLAHTAPPASTWQLQDQPHRRRSATAVGPRKMLASPKQKKAKASRPRPDRGALRPEPSPAAAPSQPLQGRFRSQAVGDSVPLVWSQLEPPGAGKKSHPDPGHGSQTKTSVSGEHTLPSPLRMDPKVLGCSADGAAVLGGLAVAPSHCHSPDASLLISYKHLYVREALGGLADPDSSTPSSSSLGPATYPPSFYPPARHASGPRQDGQAQRPVQRPRPPPSQRAPSGPAASRKAPAPLEQPQKAPAERAPSRKAPAGPAAPGGTCCAPESLSLPTPSPQALTPRSRYQMACDSAAWGAGPAGSRLGTVLESRQPGGKTEPLMLVGAQETEVTEVRAQKMSLELPGHTARREREERVVGRAREVALDGRKGRGQVEDRVRSSREERRVDLPGFRSQATGRRRKWVKTQQLAVEGAPGAPRRPFSEDELALARLMVMAKAKEPPLRPRRLGLPSWLLISQVSAGPPRGPEPLSPGQAAQAEGAPGVARERPWGGPWVKGGVGVWEDVPSHTVSTPISKMEARVSRKLKREAAGTEGGPGQGPEATAGSSLEKVVPKLVELERMRNVASRMEQTEESLQVLTPWSSVLTERALPSPQQAPSPALPVAGSRTPLSRYMVQSDPVWPGPRRRALYFKKSDAGQAERRASRLQ